MNIQDTLYILTWFLAFFIIGITFLPLTFSVFEKFKDKGYIFSKIIGTVFITYFLFVLGSLRLLKFSQGSVILSLLIFLFINYFLYKKGDILSILKKHFKIFLLEDLIFLIALFFWSYVRSNLPDIHGLEKFMDFGFLNSILRSDYFPPKDMWYTPFTINYYYFGHLATAVITKLTDIPSFITYNLMISTLFAFTFAASLSFVMNLFDIKKFTVNSIVAALLSSVLVSFGGNLTTIYAFFKGYNTDNPLPFWNLTFSPFTFPNNYWYPNATRFIYHTIHEFPNYSFVVSDLHGHVLDIPFVLLTMASIFSFFLNKKIKFMNLIFLSFLFAVMYMTNAWDGPIYLLLGFLLLIFLNTENKSWFFSSGSFYSILKNSLILVIGFFIFSLPFNIHFKPFVFGVGVICAPGFLTNIGKIGPFLFEPNHCQRSFLWQLLILYGFFYFFAVSFVIFLKKKKNYKFPGSDIFILMLIILSSILIAIPEFIYVKDIYPTYYRANTMFKLVYEAFIMLSLSCGYIAVKLLSNIKTKKILILFFSTTVILFTIVYIYPFFSINSFYGNLKTYQSLNGIKYLSLTYPGDYNLINWINKNIKGQPVILEGAGDSYTDYARISANTGLPTVIGWPVHEWLWRGSYDVVAPRIADVETIYSTSNILAAKELIKKYNIQYVVISSLERNKYPNLNENTFKILGKIVYQSKKAALYKIN